MDVSPNILANGRYVLKRVIAQMIVDLEAKYEEVDKKFAQQLSALVDTGDSAMTV